MKQEILIARYLSGEISEEEMDELQKWLNSSSDNVTYFQQLKGIWDVSEKKTLLAQVNVGNSFDKVHKRLRIRSSKIDLWSSWKKVAAVLLLPLLLGNILFFVWRSENAPAAQEIVYNELYTAFGKRSALALSDGSTVWLNSGSSIKYPDRFVGDKRVVFVKGEAYFEVKSNPERPFIVETSSLSVKATGTKFSVSGYEADHEADVTLVSGKVEVTLANDKSNDKRSLLKPNQHFFYNKTTGATSITDGDTYRYISWKDGKLIFRNASLSEVVRKLSRTYNVDIEIKGNELNDYTYRATFEDESLEAILKLLKVLSPIDYYEVERKPLPDGSFPRKKIVIVKIK